MIAKNEGETIRRALESALPFADEFVVGIDSATTDNTSVEVSKFISDNEVSASVYMFDWENDFSKARNDCIKRAKHDWIFTLDGHETIENAKKIKKVKENGLADFDVYVLDFQMNANGYLTMFQQERLFSRKYNYSNKSHNVLVYGDGKVAKISDVVINHKRSEKLMEERTVQRLEMNFDDLNLRIDHGDRRAKAQIIQEYMAQKKWGKAIEYIFYYLDDEMENSERYQVLIKLAMCYYYSKKYFQAEFYLKQCGQINADKRNAHLVFLGTLYMGYGYRDQAKEMLEQSLMIEKPKTFWFLYPQFYYETPNTLLRRLKNDNNKFKSNNTQTH